MHKHLLKLVQNLIFLLLLSTSISAQITIDRNDMPRAGDEPISSIADSLQITSPGAGGANIAWDFSNLNAISQRKDSFINVPFIYNILFFGADLVQYVPTPDSIGPIGFDEGFRFFNVSNSKYEDMGLGFELSQSPIPVTLKNNPRDIVYEFPLNYGDQATSYSEAEFDISGFDIFYLRKQTRTTHADAWGTLTTPYGTFSALRLKIEIEARDSLQFDTIGFAFDRPKQIIYRWLGKQQSVPLLEINSVEVGGQEIAVLTTYKDSLRENMPVGITDLDFSNNIEMYPNPASTEVNFHFKNSGKLERLEIWNLEGKKLRTVNLRQAHMTIPTQGLSPAMYLVKIFSNRGVYSGKLIIR